MKKVSNKDPFGLGYDIADKKQPVYAVATQLIFNHEANDRLVDSAFLEGCAVGNWENFWDNMIPVIFKKPENYDRQSVRQAADRMERGVFDFGNMEMKVFSMQEIEAIKNGAQLTAEDLNIVSERALQTKLSHTQEVVALKDEQLKAQEAEIARLKRQIAEQQAIAEKAPRKAKATSNEVSE